MTKPEICDGCHEPCVRYTIVKGFDLLCDSCLFARLAQEHRDAIAKLKKD